MTIPNIYFPHIGLMFYLPREAFHIFGITVYWYGLIMAAALLAGLTLVCYVAKKEGLSSDLFIDYVLIALPISLVGARLYYVLFHLSYYKTHLSELFNIRKGGIAIYGAVLAALGVALVFCKVRQVKFLKFADLAVLGLLLGQAIGRYGNFFNKEAFGRGTDGLFAMALLKSEVHGQFSAEALTHLVRFPQFGNALYMQVQPTFFYESCWNLMLLVILLVKRRHVKYDGQIFWFYLIGYGIGRFWIEGLRTDQLIIGNTGLPISQVIAILSILMGIIGSYRCRMAKK